ncbi:zinc-binding dehydrogenase [Streptomyces sp. RFCAC02]|uniref:zinc-binding dehydrogenase n=1 Tax=Streptomyces sp. RFCAC02 TaxID=2499143 RepID=UPI00101EF918|nr:zinc-binding dehydrogenase [Streptomyces sp. RFCAC02]
MRAIRLHAFGPAENLRIDDVPDPVPGPGEVRIAVEAAGVHLIDTMLRRGPGAAGTAPLPFPRSLPTVPGREVAGTVDALGPDTDPAWLGRRVAAHLGPVPGGYAERAVTAAANLHALPDGLAADHAVALLGTGRMTMGILRFADLTPDDTVLVLAAAGGIGTLLTQYAKHRGARVVGAAGGPAKAGAVARLGADLALDYLAPDWTDRARAALGDARPVTLLCEGVGGDTARAAVGLVARGGRHLSYGAAAGSGPLVLTPAEQADGGITSHVVVGPPLLERIGGPGNLRLLEEEALAHAAAGTFVPLVTRYPLAEAARAHRDLEDRATTGKVVLTTGPSGT